MNKAMVPTGVHVMEEQETVIKTAEPDCSSCGGACCKGVSIPTKVVDADALHWMRTRGKVEGGYWHIRSVCSFLKGGRCLVYDARPVACHRCEVGSEQCLRAIEAFG